MPFRDEAKWHRNMRSFLNAYIGRSAFTIDWKHSNIKFQKKTNMLRLNYMNLRIVLPPRTIAVRAIMACHPKSKEELTSN